MMLRLPWLCLFLLLSSCFGPSTRERLGGDILKVALVGPVADIEIGCSGQFQVQDESRPSDSRTLRSLHVRARDGKLTTTRGEVSPGPLKLKTLNPEHAFIVQERSFHGVLRVIPKGGELILVLEIPLEDYVAGVLACESGKFFNAEALKTQAVISRTYAIHKRESLPREPAVFDVWADTRDQVFKGDQTIGTAHRRATRETAGLYLAYRRKPLPCFFHSTCGGRTQDAVAAAFMKEPMTPLGGVECTGCHHSPHWRWSVSVPLVELSQTFLAESGGGIMEASVTKGAGGRHVAVILQGRRKAVIPAHLFRNRLGTSRVKSTSFEVSVEKGSLIIQGRGWGHGVGLCQWGSDGMARQGSGFKEILAHYFPGAQLTRSP